MYKIVLKLFFYIISFSFIGIITIFVIELIFFPIYTGGSSSEVYIPDVRDKYLSEARDLLLKSGLEVVEIDIPWSPGTVPGTVVGVNPQPPTKVKKGRLIEISIAGTEKSIVMPDLINYTVRNAQIEIEKLNLRQDTVKYEYSNSVSKGIVIDQTPQKNLTVTSGHPVTLIVSDGPIPGIIKIPELDTGDILLERAKSLILQSTLEVGEINYIIVPEFMPNTVISQSVYGGTIVDIPIKIDLDVTHDGKVPNLIGLSIDEATDLINKSPFRFGKTVYMDYDFNSGIIVEQSPEPNITLESFEKINITISK
tara:strand:- start:63 stop:992 length:930 start_codon:yes stop_codon:yes gene_type:complete